MKVFGISDTHSNFFEDLSLWKSTLEELIDSVKDRGGINFNAGDVVGDNNLIIYEKLNNYPHVLVPGNHDVEEIINVKIKVDKKGHPPISYLYYLNDKKVKERLEKFGYGTNLNIESVYGYFVLPEEDFALILSHFPLEDDLRDYILSFYPPKFVYNLYGHSHSSRFKIHREKIKVRNTYTKEIWDVLYISVHLPPFYLYRCGWEVSLNEKKVEIREVYFKNNDLNIREVKRPIRGDWID